ncbi:MAG: archease [Eudoraea sp.]|nr:archease [Eudoraea sp.]
MNIQYLPHTADIRMRITGTGLEDLFRAGVIGMGNILKSRFCDRKDRLSLKRQIDITASDGTCLLIDFLSEVLSASCAEKAIFCEVHFFELSERIIRAAIFGRPYNQGFDEEIKAVTYHEADVQRNNEGDWETTIIFDI